ncbi:MAG: hypothetical protein IJD36_01240 [Clostridia bacterium]|nr:hypothetical protein [Clostridia bacterium]
MKRPEISELTLREKIGQTAVIAAAYGDGIENQLEKNPYGFIWICGGKGLHEEKEEGDTLTSSDYRNWMAKFDQKVKVPVAPVMDCTRGARNFFDDLNDMVPQLNVGAADSEELTYEYSKCLTKELVSAGVRWCWSPVMDIKPSVTRVFSVHPDDAIKHGLAFTKAMQENGVAACFKHFPGGGKEILGDPHFVNTVCNISPEEWWEGPGRVFQEGIDAGVYSIMVGHSFYPKFDNTRIAGNGVTTTLSYKVVTELLKEKMGFDGVVVTDDVSMGSLARMYPREQLYVELLKAGNDAVLGVADDYIDIVEKAILDGDLEESRIDDACRRVLEMKEKLGLFADDYKNGIPITEEDLEKTRKCNTEIAEKSVTLLCDKLNQIPFNQNDVKNVAIICLTHREVAFEALNDMKSEFERRGIGVRLQRRIASKEELKEIADTNDLIIYAGYLGPHAPFGACSFYDDEMMALFHALSHGKEKSIGISLGTPYMYQEFFPAINIFANLYNYCKDSQVGFVKALFGEIPFQTKSPVDIVTLESLIEG